MPLIKYLTRIADNDPETRVERENAAKLKVVLERLQLRKEYQKHYQSHYRVYTADSRERQKFYQREYRIRKLQEKSDLLLTA